MADNEWIEHETAISDIWEYFLRSKTKISGKGNRFRAKCKRCDAVMIGKPQRMMKHLISVCKEISFEDRASIVEVKKDKPSVSSFSVCGQSATSDETATTVEKMQKGNIRSVKAFYTHVTLSDHLAGKRRSDGRIASFSPKKPKTEKKANTEEGEQMGTQKKQKYKFCMFCGTMLPVVAKFCSSCGESQIIE